MPEAVIVDTIRTPIGRAFKGSLAQLRPDELLERNPEVQPSSVEDVFCGCGVASAGFSSLALLRRLRMAIAPS